MAPPTVAPPSEQLLFGVLRVWEFAVIIAGGALAIAIIIFIIICCCCRKSKNSSSKGGKKSDKMKNEPDLAQDTYTSAKMQEMNTMRSVPPPPAPVNATPNPNGWAPGRTSNAPLRNAKDEDL
jgi:hypothetical protein